MGWFLYKALILEIWALKKNSKASGSLDLGAIGSAAQFAQVLVQPRANYWNQGEGGEPEKTREDGGMSSNATGSSGPEFHQNVRSVLVGRNGTQKVQVNLW